MRNFKTQKGIAQWISNYLPQFLKLSNFDNFSYLYPALYLLLKYFEMNPRYIILRNELRAYTEYLLSAQSQMQREKSFQGQEISEG